MHDDLLDYLRDMEENLAIFADPDDSDEQLIAGRAVLSTLDQEAELLATLKLLATLTNDLRSAVEAVEKGQTV
ncbi:hypothetical protein [Amycolatopsis sp. CA-230715]|uniref:hypothetical protein n=1 Tax=Amycolatopsis sp. CA-230715 TaxID=2745196 RepID=UPI001C02ABFE|nr:hypothetical protein [Amycolatopsis sp. CA-230715]